MKPSDWIEWATDHVRTVGVTDCHDCGAQPGEPHKEGCGNELCSVCGGQWLYCGCEEGHDPMFARWTGFWPGKLESIALGIGLNELAESGFANLFFVKPDTMECQRNIETAREAAKKFLGRETMPSRWNSRWDHWCHLRANNPTRGEWWWLVAMELALVGLIAVGVKCWMLMR